MKVLETRIIERPKALPDAPAVIEGIDGRMYSGQTLKEALEAMRRAAWGLPAKNLNGYMRQVAKRVYGWSKIIVRTSGWRIFLEDLSRAGIITIHIQIDSVFCEKKGRRKRK